MLPLVLQLGLVEPFQDKTLHARLKGREARKNKTAMTIQALIQQYSHKRQRSSRDELDKREKERRSFIAIAERCQAPIMTFIALSYPTFDEPRFLATAGRPPEKRILALRRKSTGS